MTTRTTRRSVTFTQPFVLCGLVGPQAAGTYDVETEEESVDELSFAAYRRLVTLIHAREAAAARVARIDPVELDAALMRDAGLTIIAGAEPR